MNLVSRIVATGALLAPALLSGAAERPISTDVTDEIVVTGTREGERLAETAASVSVLSEEAIETIRPAHPAEILGRVPGVAVQQTNGEGHITGIRQPIGTSAVYLFLEDGVPVRASGFFNHNAMYEVNMPQSGRVEVTRGPGTALQGSDAIGGIINVLTRPPSVQPDVSASVEGGSYTWLRTLATASDTWGDFGARADLNLTHSEGWRDASGYDRQSVTLRGDLPRSKSSLKAVLSATSIDQDTGANSFVSEDDYYNNPERNYTPIAFREVRSVRGSIDWQMEQDRALLSTVTPYVRWSSMDLLPTWMLTFDPVYYETGYASIGTLVKYRQDLAPWRSRVIVGADLDYSPGFREEDRIWSNRDGGIFRAYTNEGRLYDYDVTFWQASPYLQFETSPVERLRLSAGLRYDALGFRYDNNLADGPFQTRTSATATERTYYRPGDDNVEYTQLSPSVGATWEFSPRLNGFLSFKQSFRVPQESQLFRPGGTSDSVALKPVEADSYEAGLRGRVGAGFSWDVSVYYMEKSNDILTTNTGVGPTQTNNGETTHQGVEGAFSWQFLPTWRLDVAGSLASHEYDRWISTVDYSGNDMSSAPETVANTILVYTPPAMSGLTLEAEWVHFGSYWMDDANTKRYHGHDLGNLRVNYQTGNGFEFFARVMNVFDDRWATSTQVSAGNPQYAPGLPLTVYGGITRKF